MVYGIIYFCRISRKETYLIVIFCYYHFNQQSLKMSCIRNLQFLYTSAYKRNARIFLTFCYFNTEHPKEETSSSGTPLFLFLFSLCARPFRSFPFLFLLLRSRLVRRHCKVERSDERTFDLRVF